MEPITTSAMIAGIVSFMGTKLSKDKSLNKFFAQFSEATVNWIKPLFLEEDGTEKEIIKKLKDKPASSGRQNMVKSALEIGLEDSPAAEQYIKEMFEKISATEEGAKMVNNITNSIQTVTGNTVGNISQIYNEK